MAVCTDGSMHSWQYALMAVCWQYALMAVCTHGSMHSWQYALILARRMAQVLVG